MINVRHPLGRLYSAWRDKFRNGHSYMPIIRDRFGKYLDLFERKNMTRRKHEYSFEAFVELAALTPYDYQRDLHWKSITNGCSPCHFLYDYIVKQDNADVEYPVVVLICSIKPGLGEFT